MLGSAIDSHAHKWLDTLQCRRTSLAFCYFTKGFSSLGLQVDEMYSGGPKVRTVQAAGYTIDIHRQVSPHMFQREKSFVQLDWKPTSVLPPHVFDVVDIDGDGQPDIRANFKVPKDPKTPLHVDVEALNPRYESVRDVGKQKFSNS